MKRTSTSTVGKRSPSLSKHFFYDLDKVLQEYNDSLTTTNEYTSTDEQYGSLLSAYSSGSTSYYQPDALGSTDALINDSGSITDRYAYRAFGLEATHQGTSTNDRTFVGAQGYAQDTETSLYFVRARYYDPVTGRFMNEDPSGYRGGDANLYRYVNNDPVNEIDPSGLAVLVKSSELLKTRTLTVPLIPCSDAAKDIYNQVKNKPWDFTDKMVKEYQVGFQTKLFNYNETTDKLHNEIYKEFKPWGQYWPVPSANPIGLDTKAVTINGVSYKRLDLINSLPATLWDKVEESSSELATGLSNSRTDDYEVSIPYWQWGNDLSFSLVKQDNNSTLADWANTFSTSLINIGSLVVQGAKALAQVGLVSFLRVAGIDPDTFQKAIDAFQSLGEVVGEIATNPFKFLNNLIKGGRDAFSNYANAFPGNLINLAASWILKQLSAITDFVSQIPTTFSLENIVWFVLKVAGLTVDGVKGIVQSLVPSTTAQKAIDIVFDAVGNAPSLQNVDKTITKWIDDAGQAVYQVGDVFTSFMQELPNILKNWVLSKLPELAASFIFPGGAALLGIWKTITWALNNVKPITELFSTLANGLKAAASTVGAVKSAILDGLKSFTVVLLSFVAKQLGLDNLLQTLNQAVVKVVGWAKAKVTALIEWLLRKLGYIGNTNPPGSCGLPSQPGSPPGTKQGAGSGSPKTTCWRAGTGASTANGNKAIETLYLTCPMEGASEEERKHFGPQHWIERDRTKLRAVKLVLEEDGCRHDVERLFNAQWLELQGAAVGEPLWIELPEQGLMGEMLVTEISPCPELPPEGVPMVIGRYRHTGGRTIEVSVEGEPEPWGVTPTHMIWSVDRQNWVEAGKLCVGERLQGRNSYSMVLGLGWTWREEPVYNIEVDGDHCYRVGQQGLLVHNASTPCGGNPRGWSMVTPQDTLYLKNDNNPRNPKTRKLVLVKKVVANLDKKTGTGTGSTDEWLTEPRYMAIGGDVTNTKLITIGYGKDTVGHIIPKRFGGEATYPSSGWDPGNVFPQSPDSQDEYGRWVDSTLAPDVGGPCDVCVEITFTFSSTQKPYRPREFTVKWWLGPTEQTPVATFMNKRPS